MYPPTGTSFLCHSLYLNNVNLVLTDVNCIFFYILSKSSPFAPSQSVFIHSCKVWEHKGISKEIKQALCTGNQHKRTFTRSPAWALRVARQTIGAMRDALSSETSNRYSTRAFFVQIKKPNHNKTCWGCCKCKVSFRNGRAISTVEQQAAHWQSDKGRT